MVSEWAVRRVVYTAFAAGGHALSVGEIAMRLSVSEVEVRESLLRLHELHALVLTEYGDAIRMAHPFSAAPMGFAVIAADDDRMWWGGCAWDSFGISAALGIDVAIVTRCPECGAELRFDVGPKRPPAPTAAVVRFMRPATEWWDDVVETCGAIRVFCSAEHLTEDHLTNGRAVELGPLWALAQTWYADRLDRGYRPRSTAEAQRLLTEAGFTGEFWRLPGQGS